VTVTSLEIQHETKLRAWRRYAPDHSADGKRSNIALVVSSRGVPPGQEIFAGNRNDANTLEEMIELIQGPYAEAA